MKIKFIILALVSVLMLSCSSENDFDKVKTQLESQGYTNVTNTGHAFFCCGESDTFSTGFTATDKNGKLVKGCACSALLKGITIRFE